MTLRLLKGSTLIAVAIFACGLSATLPGISLGAETASPKYKLVDLGTLGGPYVYIAAINERGQVTGNADTASGGQHAFLYSNGSMTDLGTLGGIDSYASALNDRGQVTGNAATAGNTSYHAFLYSPDSEMLDLNSLLVPGSVAPGFYLVSAITSSNGVIAADGSDGHGYLLQPVDE